MFAYKMHHMGRKNKRIPVKMLLLELAVDVSVNLVRRDVSVDTMHPGGLYEHSTVAEDYSLQQAVVVVSPELLLTLSTRACRLIIRIMNEMKMNNLFWVVKSEDSTSHLRGAIAELKRVEVLFETDQPGLYIINPYKLRRGKPMASVMASIQHYFKRDTSMPLLTDLRPPQKGSVH